MLFIDVASQEIKEGVVIGGPKVLVPNTVLDLLSSLFILQFLLVHLEVSVEETEGRHDEHDKEVNDLKCQVSLHVKAVPVDWGLSRLLWGSFFCALFLGSLQRHELWLVGLNLFEGLLNLSIHKS